ncbi:hypothetical protein [Leifsonia shinshuensis]|uniref:Uncharacterized protein n=1 Tax=Leifsonia shinshuensis TaxID=150026 RepID=A0A853CVR5_9MICO|nr:hypothetical protein [Leifsonia shinshuensis]NYJ23481.1 hypothetical protein [Leifsonia shinshuensis]
MEETQFTISWPAKGDFVPISRGVYIVRRSTIEFIEADVGRVRIEVMYDESLGRFVAHSVSVERAADGAEVTGVNLRNLRVQDAVRWAAQHMAYIDPPDESWFGAPVALQQPVALQDLSQGSIPAEHLTERAARLYTVARIANMGPLKFVADYLGVSQSTATRIIGRAREAGLLRTGDDRG